MRPGNFLIFCSAMENKREEVMHGNRIWMVILAIALLAIVPPLASADALDVVMDNPNVTVAQGAVTQIQFFGTVTNPSLTDTIYLNGDMISGKLLPCFATTGSCVDDSTIVLWPVFFQPSLPGMPTSANFVIFNVNLFGDLAPGTYSGVFEIQGGPDGGAMTAYDPLADINFSVTVTGPVPTPEPPSLFLLAVGLLGLATLKRILAN